MCNTVQPKLASASTRLTKFPNVELCNDGQGLGRTRDTILLAAIPVWHRVSCQYERLGQSSGPSVDHPRAARTDGVRLVRPFMLVLVNTRR